ncbi:MAG TPA: acyl-CoA dehydrogenase family protein [Acidimicrobiales bacterium]|nr:acyl-CoA dehydrogenase family protein [Acidimicrobiales bacterium]
MDFEDTAEEAAFRLEARTWLKAHAREKEPGEVSSLRGFYDSDALFVEQGRQWQRTLYEGGWAGIQWPAAYGGRGGTPMQQLIFRQEEARFDVPSGLYAVAIGMAGPTIIAHGTDAQRGRYLPAMLRGDEVWCQLFSEPGAGSDLASLITRADPDGDEWVVNGQKVWSSGAHHSQFGILLARTAWDQPKHRGITFFLVDMSTPGIDVRPLRQMTGGASFNEVFLTDVRIPASNVVGTVNEGWRVTMTTLGHERSMSGTGSPFPQLVRLVREHGRLGDPLVRDLLVQCYVRSRVLEFLGYRAQTRLSRGDAPGPESSVMKLAFSQLATLMARVSVDAQGPTGMLVGGDAPDHGTWQQQFLSTPSFRIAAGTDEVQRNVLGERVLGLPPEPRADKDAPFRAGAR